MVKVTIEGGMIKMHLHARSIPSTREEEAVGVDAIKEWGIP